MNDGGRAPGTPMPTTGMPHSGVGVAVPILRPGPHLLVSIVAVGAGVGLSVGVASAFCRTWSRATGVGVGVNVSVGWANMTGSGLGASSRFSPSTTTRTSMKSMPRLPSSAHNLRARDCLPAGRAFAVHTWPVTVFSMK